MALDGNDFKFDASKIYGGVSQMAGALDPCSMAIDGLGSTLGLPPSVRNVAKVGLGVLFANPMCVISGATGLAAEATKQEPASTEYCPPKAGDQRLACAGYASTAAPRPPQYGATEALSMNSPEFMSWVPSDPYLRRWRELACNATDPQAKADYLARYQSEMKVYLDGNPQLKAEFEQQFGVMLCGSSGGANGELLIRRPKPDCATEASFDISPPARACSAGRGAVAGNSASMAGGSAGDAIDRMAGRMDTMEKDINDLLNKEELTQQDQIKLQRLMQKQQQLFTLISTLMSIQNQMAMTAINNMKG